MAYRATKGAKTEVHMQKEVVFANANLTATGHGYPSFVGVCQKCGTVKPAVDLVLKRLPFGRGEVYACRGNC